MTALRNLISDEQPLSTGRTAVFPWSEETMEKYSFTSRFGEFVELFQRDPSGQVLHLPRELFPVGQVDERVEGALAHFPKGPAPRDYQAYVFDSTAAFLVAGQSGLVNAPTGWGKLILGFHAAYTAGRKTLVITTKEDIFNQWIEGASVHLGLAPEQVGVIRGKKCDYADKPFVVALVQSLSYLDKYPVEMQETFGLVIYDECFHPAHELLTRHGWVSVADVTTSDDVIAFDAVSETCRFEPVLRTVANPFSGNLVEIRGHKFHTLTTPGHQQPVRRTKGGRAGPHRWELDRSTVGDLAIHGRVQLPVAAPLEGSSLLTTGLSNEERLRIAFEADGHHLYTSTKTGVHTYRFQFRRERKIKRLVGLLDALGIEHQRAVNARDDVSIVFKNDLLLTKDFAWFDAYRAGGVNEEFIEELTHWNGWGNEEGCFWEHVERDRVDEVQTIAQLAGYSSSVIKTDGGWRVRWFERKTWVAGSKCFKKVEVPYTGPVHCVTVPSGNVLTRLDGVVSVSGNCHRMAATTFSRVALMFPAKLRLGLTATVDRSDRKELLVRAHLGPVRVKADLEMLVPKVLVFRSEWKCPREYTFDPVTRVGTVEPISHEAGKTAHIEKLIAADDGRNRFLATLCKLALDKGRKTVVFSSQLAHLKAIDRACRKHHGVKGSQIGYYVGAVTKIEKARRDKDAEKPLVLATYGMLSEGSNIEGLDTCILAMPRADVRQPVGRIRRDWPVPCHPRVVMDVVDGDLELFEGYADKRQRWYQSIGAVVKQAN